MSVTGPVGLDLDILPLLGWWTGVEELHFVKQHDIGRAATNH